MIREKDKFIIASANDGSIIERAVLDWHGLHFSRENLYEPNRFKANRSDSYERFEFSDAFVKSPRTKIVRALKERVKLIR